MLKDSAIWCRFSFRSSIFKQIVTMGSWDQTYSSSRIFVCFLQVHWARANVRSECHHCEWSIAPHWVWSGWGSWRASDMHEASLTVIAVRKGGWTVDFSGYGAKAVLPPGDSLFFSSCMGSSYLLRGKGPVGLRNKRAVQLEDTRPSLISCIGSWFCQSCEWLPSPDFQGAWNKLLIAFHTWY